MRTATLHAKRRPFPVHAMKFINLHLRIKRFLFPAANLAKVSKMYKRPLHTSGWRARLCRLSEIRLLSISVPAAINLFALMFPFNPNELAYLCKWDRRIKPKLQYNDNSIVVSVCVMKNLFNLTNIHMETWNRLHGYGEFRLHESQENQYHENGITTGKVRIKNGTSFPSKQDLMFIFVHQIDII